MMHLLFYTNSVPSPHAACSNGPAIRIRPEYKGDTGLLAHELVHVSQWWRTLGFHSILYLLSKSYRLRAEVEAYKAQLSLPPANGSDEYRNYYAEFISTRYGLSISKLDAYKLLKDGKG